MTPTIDTKDPSRMTVAESDPPTAIVRRDSFVDLPPGSIVGEIYEIDARLGAGAMGEVYAARHTKLGKRVAIKVIRAHLSENVGAIERFALEARTLAQIQHPTIVAVEHVGELADGRAFFVMEFLRGESLFERIQRGRVPLPEALRILDQIARGLDAAHAQGVTHRDLKPENIFLVHLPGEAPLIKLLDYGLAKLRDGDDADHRSERSLSGVAIGTPKYMSPEQARGPERRPPHRHLRTRLRRLRIAAPPISLPRCEDGPRAVGRASSRIAAPATIDLARDPTATRSCALRDARERSRASAYAGAGPRRSRRTTGAFASRRHRARHAAIVSPTILVDHDPAGRGDNADRRDLDRHRPSQIQSTPARSDYDPSTVADARPSDRDHSHDRADTCNPCQKWSDVPRTAITAAPRAQQSPSYWKHTYLGNAWIRGKPPSADDCIGRADRRTSHQESVRPERIRRADRQEPNHQPIRPEGNPVTTSPTPDVPAKTTYKQLLDRVISDGIVAARIDYADKPYHLSGAVDGFEACRNKTVLEIIEIHKIAERQAREAHARSTDDYWAKRCYVLEVEWILNVLSVGFTKLGFPPLLPHLPTARAVLKYADIVGVSSHGDLPS